ncbi:MAG: PilN domain-containing protein [Patescibacteria group bacterium]
MFEDSINLLPDNKRDLEKKQHFKNEMQPVRAVEFSQPNKIAVKEVSPITFKKIGWWNKVWHKLVGRFKNSSPTTGLDNLIKQPLKPLAVKGSGLELSSSPDQSKNQSVSKDVKTEPVNNKGLDQSSEALKNQSKGVRPDSSKKKSDLPEVNLIPSDEQGGPIARARALLVGSAILSVVLVLLSAGGLFYYNTSLKNKSEIEQSKLINLQNDLEILRSQAEDSLFFQTKIQAIQAMLDKRGSWAPLFGWLEKNTVPDIYFTGFAGDSGGRITLAGLAPNYTQVAKQFKIFSESPSVKQVEVTNLRIQKVEDEVTNVSFSFIVVAPDFFLSSGE